MAYIGKTVQTPGGTAYGRTGGGLTGAVELGDAASRVTVSIADPSGNVLKQMDLGASPKGTVAYDWDGKTQDGGEAGSGPFTITVAAQSAGKTVPATNLVWAPVGSVSTTSGSTVLTLPGLGEVPVSAVRQIG